MKTLNLEIKNKAVDEFIDSLNEKGILSNFVEEFCKSLLNGYVLTAPEEELVNVEKSETVEQTEALQFVESELDTVLSNVKTAQEPLTLKSDVQTNEKEDVIEEDNGGYFELNEDDLDISDMDFDDDDYDDVEDDDEEDGVMYIPPPPIDTEETDKEKDTSDNSISEGFNNVTLNESDRVLLETVKDKLVLFLNMADSGMFSGSRVTPLTFPKFDNNSSKSDSEEDNVTDEEPPTSSQVSTSVNDIMSGLDIQQVLSINNKLSGR